MTEQLEKSFKAACRALALKLKREAEAARKRKGKK